MKQLCLFCCIAIGFSSCLSAQESTFESEVRQNLQPFVERNELAGAVMLVAQKDKVVAQAAVGYADVSAKSPMKTDSIFWIASQSKPITATALMMLVDEGKVNVNDPVEKYLPEFRNQMVIVEKDADHILLRKPAKPITVANVLSHTSGLPFRSAIEVPTLDRLPLADRVRSYAMTPLEFQPESSYQYSNAGINTAARIVEVVANKPFEDFLDERLFRPLGMKDTTFWPSESQVKRIAKSYKPGADNNGLAETPIGQLYYPLTDRTSRFPMPAGGLFSTASDLARFYRMLANEGELDGRRYLSKKSLQKMTTKQTSKQLKNEYGFGFSTGGQRVGHGGAYFTNSYLDKEQGLILVWLVQHAGFPGNGGKSQDVFRKIAIEHFGKK